MKVVHKVNNIGLNKVEKMMSLIKLEDIEAAVQSEYYKRVDEMAQDARDEGFDFSDSSGEMIDIGADMDWDIGMFDVLYSIYETLEYRERVEISKESNYRNAYDWGVEKRIKVRCNELVKYGEIRDNGEWICE